MHSSVKNQNPQLINKILKSLFYFVSLLMFISLSYAQSFINQIGKTNAFLVTWGIFFVIFSIYLVYEPKAIMRFFKTTMGRAIMTLLLCVFYVAVYFNPHWIKGWILLCSPLSELLNGSPADQWFLYSLLYTYLVLIFAYSSWCNHGSTLYHKWRTISVAFFQLAFAFLLPNILKGMQLPDFYFTYFWPLKPDYLLPFDYIIHPQTGLAAAEINGFAIGRAMLLWGILMSVVATPILTYYFGKRWYCSWVCGCGALAETFGDAWRTETPKGKTAWVLERYSIYLCLLLTIIATIFLWYNEYSGRTILGNDGAQWFWGGYGLWITMIFSGVIGVGFYPLFGSRVWCRFGCPQAAILGILQRFFSRFRITTNGGQCVSCGQCSAHCEMGIDVRAYAQEGDVILRASCVGCGVCASVCPRGVLRLENKKDLSN